MQEHALSKDEVDAINQQLNKKNRKYRAAHKLPVFKEYTVDERLQQFRRAVYPGIIEFIPFDSPKGITLLTEYRKSV